MSFIFATEPINAGGGLLRPTLLSAGRALGTWKSTKQKNRLEVQIEPFAHLAPDVAAGVEAEISDLARFLETPIVSRVMAPL